MAGVWYGAAGYADDLILLAPSRTALEMMLQVCESYAERHNLVFSTDPDIIKSKSKCIFMCGSARNITYPAPLQLYGTDLPWVLSATHLGHELHQMCTMEFDIKTKKAIFISNSTDIRDTFRFAKPDQILKATSLYCCHLCSMGPCCGTSPVICVVSSAGPGTLLSSWHGKYHGVPTPTW